jgi:hypothetical protein
VGDKAHKGAVYGSLILLGGVILIASVYVIREMRKEKV